MIVCEGERTEPIYFERLNQEYRLHIVRVVKGGKEGTPVKLVEKAIEEKRKGEADEVWCVCDTESRGERPQLNKAVEKARAHGIRLAVSNPAFEYWYLLHFERTDRPFRNANEVIEALRKHLPDYDKGGDVFRLLDDKMDTAIENAHRLREQATKPWSEFPNPSTGVVDLVERLRVKEPPPWQR